MEKQRECGGGTPSRGEGGVPPSEGSDSPKVPPGKELGGVLLLMPGEVEEPPPGLLSREPLCAGCGGGPRRELGGGAGPDRRRPCSRRRKMLQVANDSFVEEERLSESLVVSFFCLVRRFWNHTLTCNTHNQEDDDQFVSQAHTQSVLLEMKEAKNFAEACCDGALTQNWNNSVEYVLHVIKQLKPSDLILNDILAFFFL